MTVALLRSVTEACQQFVDRHPYTPAMPLSAQLAVLYVGRVSRVAGIVEIAVTARFQFEAIGLIRPLFETFIKTAYILQSSQPDDQPEDRPRLVRERAARDIWNHELSADSAMFERLADLIPGHFNDEFLQGMGAAGQRAEVQGAGGLTKLAQFAEAAGVTIEYRMLQGTLSLPCHGTANGSRQAMLPTTDEQILGTLRLCARSALRLLDVASQVLDDQPARDRALELLNAVHQASREAEGIG